MQIEKYIADKITSLCEKRDISKYRLSQFFQEGNSENLTEKQIIAAVWNFPVVTGKNHGAGKPAVADYT